ncbi:hypothetical protein E4U57_007095 [Claviceps arundinis]|uniref:Uncharacterized protein n=1 Tax=Claviceps arundinis TaxID=1623583 RepID=A0ABQ7PHF3_9HYPO|nr:hypothetical protein E4U57_007095 [Claviceps arundinis]
MPYHQIQTPHVDSIDELFVQDSDEKHFLTTSPAADYEVVYEVPPEAEIDQEFDFALATDQPHEDIFPGMENFHDEAADFFDLIWGSDPIWNADENNSHSTLCLEPRVGVDEAVEASSPGKGPQISFDKLRRLLDQRKVQREAAEGADSDPLILSEEDYADLYPTTCTQEQWDQVMADYSMVDVADVMLAHLEYTAKVQSEAAAATGS